MYAIRLGAAGAPKLGLSWERQNSRYLAIETKDSPSSI
jgi:hypothetical protein